MKLVRNIIYSVISDNVYRNNFVFMVLNNVSCVLILKNSFVLY